MTDNNRYDKDLVSILAHDLRTPISSARNFIDLAKHSGPVTDQPRIGYAGRFCERDSFACGEGPGPEGDVRVRRNWRARGTVV